MPQKTDEAYRDVSLRIPSNARYLKIVRSVLEAIGQMFDFHEHTIQSVLLATDEACANIINHAYKEEPNHFIYVDIYPSTERLRIELRDNGIKVPPEKIKPRDLEDVRPGGLGVHLMRSLMDEVIFDQTYRAGNRLILIKERSQKNDKQS